MFLKKLKERLLGDYVIDPRHDIVIYDILVRDGFIPVTLFLGCILTMLIIVVRSLSGFYILSACHIILVAALLVLIYLYKIIPRQGLFRFIIFLIFLITLAMSMGIKGGSFNQFIFILIFPVITYNLSGIKIGTIWNILLGSLFLILIILTYGGFIQNVYQLNNLLAVLILYSFISFFSYYAELRHSSIEKLILRQLYYDNTSGLPARKMLDEDIPHMIYPSLLILRIDNFHDINTFFGYSLGDEFLKFIGKRINIFSASFKIKAYNLTGGEFAFLLDMKSNEDTSILKLKTIAQELIKHITDEKFIHRESPIPLHPYVGIAPFNCSENLISKADIALHHAIKEKLPFHIYNDNDDDRSRYFDNIQTLTELNDAIVHDRIVPYFQGIICNHTGIIDKFESLMRIIDKSGNPQLPEKYLEVARKTNLYDELTEIMVRKVFSHMKNNTCTFSINITVDNIYNPDFTTFLLRLMKENPHCSGRVILEFVESERIDNYALVADFITRCKSFGYYFAIDDFGSGYSNFSYLARLNIDYVKFDGSIIHKIDSDPITKVIVKNVTALCKELNIKTVAEFVENEFILNAVNNYGIDYSQGYIINRPAPSITD